LTDQKNLSQLAEQILHTSWQKKVFSKLLGLSYKIIYRKGTENWAAHALSHYPVGSCATILVAQPQWLAAMETSYEKDEHV
jgi:hypothetical protein